MAKEEGKVAEAIGKLTAAINVGVDRLTGKEVLDAERLARIEERLRVVEVGIEQMKKLVWGLVGSVMVFIILQIIKMGVH